MQTPNDTIHRPAEPQTRFIRVDVHVSLYWEDMGICILERHAHMGMILTS